MNKMVRGWGDMPHRPERMDMRGRNVRRCIQRYLTPAERHALRMIRTLLPEIISQVVRQFPTDREASRNSIQMLHFLKWWYSTQLSYTCGTPLMDYTVLGFLKAIRGCVVYDIDGRLSLFKKWFVVQDIYRPYVDRIAVRWQTGSEGYGPIAIVERRRLGRAWVRIY